MRAEVICVGSELLTGDVADTNGELIARELSAAGIEPVMRVTVADDAALIAQAIDAACGRAGVVIVAGGLGPTHDDVTRDGVAAATGRPLEPEPALEEAIRDFFRGRGREMSEANRAQAQLPAGASSIANPLGTAPGIALEHRGAQIFVLPGVPGEMKAMLQDRVLPELAGGAPAVQLVHRRLGVVGIGESDLAERIRDVVEGCASAGQPILSILATGGRILVGLRARGATTGEAEAIVAPVEDELRRRLGRDLFGSDGQTLEAVVIELAGSRGLTVSVAESFTGGLVAARLVSVPGSSDVFHTGFVTYAREAKVKHLGVSEEVLDRHGAVSEQTARSMAEGARVASGASIGVSTTGEAGPVSQEKPVGTMYVGLATPNGTRVHHLVASGGREEIRATGCTAALDLLRRWLLEEAE